MIYSYQKHIDELRTVEMALPVDGMQRLGTELATIDGTTYVHVPDSAALPEQPIEIDVAPVSLTVELADAIKEASPHVWLVNDSIKAKIRQRYDAETEMYFARISIGAITGQYTMEPGEAEKVTAYGAYVEEVRQWGRDQRAGFGL